MEYSRENIEFAFRVLNDRESLDDGEMEAWMKVPVHLRLLNDMEAVRQQLAETEGESDLERLEREMRERKSRRMTLRWVYVMVIAMVLLLWLSRYFQN